MNAGVIIPLIILLYIPFPRSRTMIYLPPNQLDSPVFASAALVSTLRSNSSTFFSVLALTSFAYASASALILAASA